MSPVVVAEEYSSSDNQTLVALTFDDGYRCWTRSVMPVLSRYGLTATGLINSPDFLGTFNWDDITALHDAGWEIGWHTASHMDVTTTNRAALINDFETAKGLFEVHGLPVLVDFAYPWGEYDDSSIEVVSEYFQAARTLQQGIDSSADIRDHPFHLSSFKIKEGVPFLENMVDRYIGQGILIDIQGHIIGQADPISEGEPELTEADFESLARFLYEKKRAGEIDVVTLAEGVRRAGARESAAHWHLALESPLGSWDRYYGVPVPARYHQLYDLTRKWLPGQSLPRPVSSLAPLLFAALVVGLAGFAFGSMFTFVTNIRQKNRKKESDTRRTGQGFLSNR